MRSDVSDATSPGGAPYGGPSGTRGARVGDLEKVVLEVLWAAEDWSTVREVFAVIEAERPIAYTTVMTVLARMAKKGLVEQRRDGKAYLYRASATRGEMAADLMRQALGSVADDAGGARDALVAFVGEATEEERAALREALARLEG